MLQTKSEPGSDPSERSPPGICNAFSRACLVALLLAFGFALGCATARAASLDEALAHFTADDFDETITGINEVAASGSPRAETIIRALQNG